MKDKIFVVASYADSLINFRLQLMQEFLKRDFEVVALAPHDLDVKKILETKNIRFIDIPLQRNGTNPLKDIKLLIALRNIFRKEKPSIVFSYTIKPVVYASLAAQLAGISQIYSLMTGTGYAFSNHNLKSKLIGKIARKLLKTALSQNTKVFFQNPDNLAFFIKENLITSQKPVAIFNGSGVDCQAFYPAPQPADVSFLMIARLLYCKGVCEYVSAAAKLKKQYPHVRFKLVGWRDTNPESVSQQELDNWIKQGDIEFLGKLSDVRDSIADSSVYVLPSWNEGMPRTVLEAMAMGKPIITTDTPGCKETVIPSKNGFLIPVQNVDALYKAMAYFILHPEKISGMGEVSRQVAVEKYDVNKVNRSMLEAMGIRVA
ncbi:MAG: glycosyltransferase family 4 protein [Gammaproteobacteria bacterium]|nr:glycosyltransferase family 4 protein [Gammaproteobacteria bacterium]